MKPFNYTGKWHASEWDNPFGALSWKYDHVRPQDDRSVDFVLDMFGAPELQGQTGQGYYTSGTWEVDVTLPQMRDGLVVAPLWLYNHNTKEEFDFEFTGRKGLDLTIHAHPGGVHKKSTKKILSGEDWSGRRARFAIKLSVEQGWAEMYLDGKLVHRFEGDELGYFATKKFKPVISMWAADSNNRDFTNWLGQWRGITPDEKLVMKVHGYRYTPLPS